MKKSLFMAVLIVLGMAVKAQTTSTYTLRNNTSCAITVEIHEANCAPMCTSTPKVLATLIIPSRSSVTAPPTTSMTGCFSFHICWQACGTCNDADLNSDPACPGITHLGFCNDCTGAQIHLDPFSPYTVDVDGH